MRQLPLIDDIWTQVCNINNIHQAYQNAAKGKRSRPDVAEFSFNLESELWVLREQLVNFTYFPGNYRQFEIYDKKARIISVAPFRDRVIHHALMNILEPLVDKQFIYHSYACRKGKGVHQAVDYYQEQSKKYAYVLKMDIQRYFPSINHFVLKKQIAELLGTGNAFELLCTIIDNGKVNAQESVGLPIGNLTSQILANLYLNDLDRKLVATPNISYLRYVDDLFILGNSKNQLWSSKLLVDNTLKALKLRLHKNKSHIFLTKEKVDVLGYKVTPAKRWLRNQNGYRMQRKLLTLKNNYSKGALTTTELKQRIASWIGHASHGETWQLRKRLFENIVFSRNT